MTALTLPSASWGYIALVALALVVALVAAGVVARRVWGRS